MLLASSEAASVQGQFFYTRRQVAAAQKVPTSWDCLLCCSSRVDQPCRVYMPRREASASHRRSACFMSQAQALYSVASARQLCYVESCVLL